MTGPALDASAVLAFLFDEAGGAAVRDQLDGAALSTVNLCEVIQRAQARKVPTDLLREDLETLGVEMHDFTPADAEHAAALHRRGGGLSLGDRACIALATRLARPALTADRGWAKVDLGVEVRLVRP